MASNAQAKSANKVWVVGFNRVIVWVITALFLTTILAALSIYLSPGHALSVGIGKPLGMRFVFNVVDMLKIVMTIWAVSYALLCVEALIWRLWKGWRAAEARREELRQIVEDRLKTKRPMYNPWTGVNWVIWGRMEASLFAFITLSPILFALAYGLVCLAIFLSPAHVLQIGTGNYLGMRFVSHVMAMAKHSPAFCISTIALIFLYPVLRYVHHLDAARRKVPQSN